MRVAAVAALVLSACSGVIDVPLGAVGGTGVGGGSGSVTAEQPLDCSTPQAMRVPTQRLSAWQYENIVREALGNSLRLGATFPTTQTQGAPYSTYPEANPPADFAIKGIAETAEALADSITDTLPTCDAGTEENCARGTLTLLATKLFRRTPTKTEVDRLVAFFTATRKAAFTYRESVALSVSVLLQQPQTLYMVERSLDAGTPTLPLDNAELAQRMGLLYLGGLPDTELQQVAHDGGLSVGSIRKAQASRLISTVKGRAALSRFIYEFLQQDGFVADQFPAEVQASLNQELSRLVNDAVGQANGFEALLTSKKGFVDATLETFYGLPTGTKGADGWREVTFDARVGILTHPLLMARTAHGKEPSVIFRGKFVRTMLLCGQLSAPPPGATAMQPDAGVGTGPRAASEARMQIALCNGCHTVMDPIGFGFLQYDGAGTFSPATDAHGQVFSGGDLDGTFDGVRELGERMAKSDDVSRCFSRQWLRYAFGKREDPTVDACTVKAVGNNFITSGRNLESLFTSLAELDAFALRRPETFQ